MPGRRVKIVWVFFVVFVGGSGLLEWLRKPSSTPFLRGAHIAEKQGCFACHGTGGLSGVPNPGDEDDIPSWNGGTAMMFLENDGHIREFIEDGHRKGDDGGDGIVKMPAYRKHLSENQILDLIAYVKGVSAFYPELADSLRSGMEQASKAGCFGCHGPSGRGGVHNPGSFKGLIPGWDDPQINDLARDEREAEEWIRTGTLKRLEKNPVAHFFMRRQLVKMPAYDTILSVEKIREISHYIRWLGGGKKR